ncbi:MAG: helix-turn-helix domain-containing protein [Proteobacteria bacterium]|nr:helix-turn-helix domain-containing protein [Pseudomonadota bacterium]
MRPFHHPNIQQVSLPTVLHALGDPIRLALLAQLACGKALNCAQAAKQLADLPLSTRHHHLRILREAGIIRSTRNGTSVMNELRTPELEGRFPGLFATIMAQFKTSH